METPITPQRRGEWHGPAIVALTLVVLVGLVARPGARRSAEVDTERLVVRDRSGNIRMVADAGHRDRSIRLTLIDGAGAHRAELRVEESGDAGLYLLDDAGGVARSIVRGRPRDAGGIRYPSAPETHLRQSP